MRGVWLLPALTLALLGAAPAAQAARDCAADRGTACTLVVGRTAAGRFGGARDVDWYRVRLAAGVVYRVEVGPMSRDLRVDARGGRGSFSAGIGDSVSGPSVTQLFFHPAETGTYFITLARPGGGPGPYTVRLTPR